MDDCSCGEKNAGAAGVPAVPVFQTLVSAFSDIGGIWRTFLAFLLWFAVAAIPWVNVGATIGLAAVVCDIGRGRPVSPIDVWRTRWRKDGCRGLATFSIALAALAGTLAFGLLAAFHAGLVFAVFPGWTVTGALLPCPCLAKTAFQRLAAVAVCASGFVPALILAASWSFALPVFADSGDWGFDALKKSARLVSGNTVPVLVLMLIPAVLALALPWAVAKCGASVLSIFLGEALLATASLRIAGCTYKALLAIHCSRKNGEERPETASTR